MTQTLVFSALGRVAELADAQDLKSCGPLGPCGFEPRPGYLFRRSHRLAWPRSLSRRPRCAKRCAIHLLVLPCPFRSLAGNLAGQLCPSYALGGHP